MRFQIKPYALLGLILFFFFNSLCRGATITGTVKRADGGPFAGAFVEAQNAKTKITVIVLSDSQGRYRIPDLPAGDYRVQIRAVGYRADPRNAVTLAADQNAPLILRCRRAWCAGMKFPSTRRRSSGPLQKGRTCS